MSAAVDPIWCPVDALQIAARDDTVTISIRLQTVREATAIGRNLRNQLRVTGRMTIDFQQPVEFLGSSAILDEPDEEGAAR